MPAFFSDTDTKTLEIEGADRNNFVSLIVNNDGNYSAAITRKIEITRNINETGSYKVFGEDKSLPVKKVKSKENKTIIVYNKLEVTRPVLDEEPDEIMLRIKRLKEIKAAEEKEAAEKRRSLSSTSFGGYGSWDDDDYGYHNYGGLSSAYPGYTPKVHQASPQPTLFKPETYHAPKVERIVKEGDIHYPATLIKSLVTQILTGSICSIYTSKTDIDALAKSLATRFTKRFGDLDSFSSWLIGNISYIMESTVDDGVFNKVNDEVERTSILAQDLIDVLKGLTWSSYMEAIINELKEYLFIE